MSIIKLRHSDSDIYSVQADAEKNTKRRDALAEYALDSIKNTYHEANHQRFALYYS